MTKHTPGPWNWHAQGEANEFCLLTNEKRWVISFRQNGELMTPEEEANAQLISATPDMAEELENAFHVYSELEDAHPFLRKQKEQIKAVLAKAYGRFP